MVNGVRQPRPLALLMTGVVILVSALSSRARGAQPSPLPRHALAGQTPNAVIRGAATQRAHHSPNAVLTLHIGLGVHNAAAIDALIAAASNRSNPQYGHYLARAQYRARFAPTRQEEQAVQDWARAAGLAVRAVSPERLYVTVQGSTSRVERALGVTINDYSLLGRSFFSNDRDPAVPANLPIRAISGLTTIERIQPALNPQGLRSNCAISSGDCYIPGDFQAAYGASHISDGSGQTIALTLWGAPVPQSDLDGFTHAVNSYPGQNLPPLVSGQAGADGIDWIGVNGNTLTPVNAPGYTTALAEAAMDVEYAHGVAPHSHLKVYLADMVVDQTLGDYFPDAVGLVAAADAAANDPSVHIVSNSWGGRDATLEDPAFVSNYDAVLQYAASVGTTFYFSTGDQGYVSGAPCKSDVTTCTTALPQYPAESRYVVAVGGTTLTTNVDSTYNTETAWSGSGGGCTGAFAAPWWQTGTGTAPCTTATGSPGRTVPDVAANADVNTPALVYVQGGIHLIGGTSLAVPLWAGFAADIAHYLSANGQAQMGFAAPVLYQLATNPATYSRDYHDVTSGSNDPAGGTRGYSAGPGYDQVTGWGSPAVDNLGADWTAGAGVVQTAVVQQTPTAQTPQTPTAQAPQTATAQAQQTATAQAQQTNLPIPPTRTPLPANLTSLSQRKSVLKVILPLQHGRLAGNSVLTVTAQTRPRTRVTVTLTLTRRPGREPKGHTARMVRPLYAVALHTMSDARGHVVARVRLAYNPAHVMQGTLRVRLRTITGAAARVASLTLVHADAPQPRHASGRKVKSAHHG
jgi:kumamolisin